MTKRTLVRVVAASLVLAGASVLFASQIALQGVSSSEKSAGANFIVLNGNGGRSHDSLSRTLAIITALKTDPSFTLSAEQATRIQDISGQFQKERNLWHAARADEPTHGDLRQRSASNTETPDADSLTQKVIAVLTPAQASRFAEALQQVAAMREATVN